jgi:AraC-like DNA-binding protein
VAHSPPTFETILARGPRFIIDRAEELDIPRRELLDAAGIEPAELEDPDARFPLSKLAGLWRFIIEREPDPALGVRFGRAFEIRKAGLVGYVILNCSSLREALETIVRYSRILNEAVRPRFELEGGRGRLSWAQSRDLRAFPPAVDWGLASMLICLRQACGTDLRPVEVRFPHPRPRPLPEEFREHFGPNLRFDRSMGALAFNSRQLDLPVQGADSDLKVYLERHAEEVLEELSAARSVTERARRAIWSELREGQSNLASTADVLGMSARTLQRRLRDEGTSFAALRDELLRHLATHLLRDRGMAIHEISFLLGYSEPSAFYRAFRRWETTSPDRYRATG